MPILPHDLSYSVKPRKLEAFAEVLGKAPGFLTSALADQVRIMSATSNDGIVLLLGTSSLWLIPWAMDALQPGTRVVVVVEPDAQPLVARLGALVQDDLRLAIRIHESNSFLTDMVEQKLFDS